MKFASCFSLIFVDLIGLTFISARKMIVFRIFFLEFSRYKSIFSALLHERYLAFDIAQFTEAEFSWWLAFPQNQSIEYLAINHVCSSKKKKCAVAVSNLSRWEKKCDIWTNSSKQFPVVQSTDKRNGKLIQWKTFEILPKGMVNSNFCQIHFGFSLVPKIC